MLLLPRVPIPRFPESPEISDTKRTPEHLLQHQPEECGAGQGGVWLEVGEAAQGSLVSCDSQGVSLGGDKARIESKSEAAGDPLATVIGS